MGRVGSLLPGLTMLRGYRRSWLRGDLVAGVTVAAYLVPQVMAYAEVAGLPAVAGLWAILGSLLVYALLGSSPHLSVGPESTTALMTATVIAPLALGDPDRYASLAAALAGLVGVICVLAWLLRLGFLAELLSRPVLIGYMAGVAVIMITGQLGKVTGVDADGDGPVGEVLAVLRHLDQVKGPTLGLSAAVLVALVLGTRLAPRAPMPLVAILGASLAVPLLGLDRKGLRLVGEIPASIPVPSLPAVDPGDLRVLLLAAVGVAVVGYTDNVLTGRAFAVRNGYKIDANSELLALGAANLASATLKGFPLSSSGSRTTIAESLGARSQLYSLVALGAVLATLLAGRGLLARFPLAALGALVIWAATRLVDVAEFRRLARFRRSELVLALATTVGVLVADILYGVLVAVGLSVLDLLRRVAWPHDGILGYAPGVAGMHDIDDYPSALQIEGLVAYRYDSPLFFANAENFRTRATAAVDAAPTPAGWFLLNAQANVQVDLTAIDMLDELRTELAGRGVVMALARVTAEVEAELRQAGFLDRLGPDLLFATLPTAVQAYAAWFQAEHGRPPRGLPD
jgi:sulfate permease, SulP family